MRSDARRAAEVLASVRALGAYNPATEAPTFARSRSQSCRATYVDLPDGSLVEIHDDPDASYAAFRSDCGAWDVVDHKTQTIDVDINVAYIAAQQWPWAGGLVAALIGVVPFRRWRAHRRQSTFVPRTEWMKSGKDETNH